MKLVSTLAFYFLISFLSFPVYAEEIRDFQVEIFISNDASISVEENIEYDFGSEFRHGIFRDITYEYQVGIQNYNLRMDVNKVTDFDGNPYNYEVSSGGGRVNVKIGDADKMITGVHGYRIEYGVNRAIVFFEDHDELYWNVTGNEWTVPIKDAGAKVYFPREIPKGVRAACYTGVYGSTEGSMSSWGSGDRRTLSCSYNITPSAVEFSVSRSFSPGEGLTIVLGLPKGILKGPSSFQKFSWFIADNWFFGLPFLTLFAMSYVWLTRGRDPEGRGAVAVKYEPPKDLTPAEAGTLIDESADILDITSTIIDLAVRGYMKIHEVEGTKFFFFSDTDYKLVKIKESDGKLKPHETKVLSGVFGSKDQVMVSDLRNKFYTHLPDIKESLYKELIGAKYFLTSPERVRSIFKWVGLGTMFVAFYVLFVHPALGISVGASGLIIFIFSRFVPRKTKTGTMAQEELLGFREFIQRAEKDRIERLAQEDPTLFDRVLPYALVFGLGDKWANAFRDMYRQPPSWYDSPRYTNSFSPRIFVNDIGRSLSTMNSTLVSSPSKSRSGGSGFSGGSSGGGFGGGGGGSW